MPSRSVRINNTLGLHLRFASEIVKLASEYRSDIYLQKDNMKADGKSVLGIATLGAVFGSTLEIITKGPDSEELLEAVVQLIEKEFDE